MLFSAFANAKVSFEVTGVKSEVEDNILAYLESIAAPKSGAKNLGPYQDSLTEEAYKSLKALGYYNSTVSLDVSENPDKKKQLKVKVKVVLGPPVKVTELDLKLLGEARHDETFLEFVNKLPLKEGMNLNHGTYSSAKSSVVSQALQRGYFNGKYQTAKVEVKAKQNTAKITLHFDSGIRYRFGQVEFVLDSPAEALSREMVPFEQGDYYHGNIISQYSLDLSDTNYFDSVLVRPNIEKAVGNQVPIEVSIDLKPKNTYEVGAGVTTDAGPRVKFKWTRPWVNQHGHSLGTELELSEPKQIISAFYKVPVDDPNDSYFNFQTGYQRLDENDTDSKKYTLTVRRFWRTPGNWERTAFLKYDIEDSIQGSQALKTNLIIPGISYVRTRVRGGINAYWGDKQLMSVELSNKIWTSDEDIIRLHGQTKWLRTFNQTHRLLTRLELGFIQADSIYNVPSSMRFFAGGDQSIRGYDYKSIAPKDEAGKLIGGRYLGVGSVEYSYPILEKWRGAAFVDFGNATNDFDEELKVGAGIGVAWSSPVGPLKMFLGVPVNDDEEDGVKFHFLMGPEL
ncbi:outer membrane protein assembly factor [Motilimonas pumila]|uniref:Translocation and assembly module subunit TamA n=1 Tax=Motilimonas pumila TaxID=2303987 RepID=A0A418YFZ8_9GAMM|nr:outer membrane protein assembly factor [Motilimonas pumila]